MSRDPLNLPDIRAKVDTPDAFEEGIKPHLKAKSHRGSGSLLHDHSLQAGRMALTVTESLNIPEKFRQKLRVASFAGGLFHDLGKAAAGFQEMIRNRQVNRWPPGSGGYRHEMLSAVIFLANTKENPAWTQDPDLLRAVYLSIIVHHKPFREGSTGNYPRIIDSAQWPGGGAFNKMYAELLLNKQNLQDSWNTLLGTIEQDIWGEQLIQDGFLPRNLDIPESPAKATLIYNTFIEEYNLPGYKNGHINSAKFHKKVSQESTKFMTYVRAAVTVGDHLSSGNYLFLPLIPHLKRYKLFSTFSPRSFQEKCGRKGSLLLRAPTGSGKTEASLHWIQKNQKTSDNRLGKVFYVLPFQASINAMFERLGNWVGSNKALIGLQHSRAAQILFGIIEEEVYEGNRDQILHNGRAKVKKYHDPWSELTDIKTLDRDHFSDLLLDEGLQRDYWSSPVKSQINTAANSLHRLTRENFYPIKVTTPHQLLGGVLQGRGWEASVQEFEGACFVFDEIHVFDAHLTGLILGMASVLYHEFNAKLMFMSASFPTFLIELIQEYVSEDLPLIELDPDQDSDAMVLKKKRHNIEVTSATITQLCEDPTFVQTLVEKESVLLICNTVATAQEVYEILQNHETIDPDTVMLFHSRFKMEDRKVKERQISNIDNSHLQFVVATQVVEVSLDIDLEYGIFEAAPLDATIQRMGRVNRNGDRRVTSSNVLICRPQGYWKFIYDEETTNLSLELLEAHQHQDLSEMQLVELIDELYSKIGWSEQQWNDFRLAYGNNTYQNFFSSALPGTYRRWIDDVIVDQSTMDVLHWQDVDEYWERRKKEPLRALDLLIPARVSSKEFSQSAPGEPRILTKNWNYSPETGLFKEEN